jgi:hypothetical protein
MHRRRQNNQYSLILSALVFLTSFFAMPRSSSAYEKSPVVHETIDDSAKGNPPIHFLYQVPKLSKGPRALFLLFHGCAHDAFDWFEGKEESCAECRGLPVEVQIAHFAYEQNMAVLAISSLQGCWQQNPDSGRVYKVLKAFSEKDGSDIGDLADKEHVDVYAFGASSGGSFVSHILPQIFDDHFGHLKMRLKGVISQIAPPPELGKITLPMVFSHMPKDVRIARAVRSAVVEMEKSSDVPVKESELHPMKVHETFFRDNAPPGYYETHESEKMFEALKLNGYLDDDGYLKEDPRRSDWRNVICGSLEGENRLAPDAPCENNKSWTSELMNVAWASHEMRFDTFAEDLKFLMEASHFGNQAIEFEDELDENNDMEFHEKREDEGPAPAPSATEEFNLMSQSGDGERMPTRANRPTKRGQPEFPPHWGPVPRMQTRDYRQYPPPYEEYFGSGTVVKWILKQQDMDRENPERAPKEDEGEEAEATKLSHNDEEDGEGTQSEEIEFPKRWGDPPDIQTMDYVELPPPYGHGSSTLRSWIEENLRRDAEFRIPKRREKPAAVEEEEEEEEEEENGNEL